METEPSVLCADHSAAVTETNSNYYNGSSGQNSSSTNNNNIVVKNDCNQQISKSTNNAIVIDDGASRNTADGSSVEPNDKSIENCDNDENGVAVAFAEIHLNNNESNIGFVDDEEEAVGETIDDGAENTSNAGEGTCCKPDANNCGTDAATHAADGKHFAHKTLLRSISLHKNLFLV